MKKITLITAVAIGLVGAANAGVIFNAATDNTTVVYNDGAGTLAGTPGALTYTSPVTSFNNSGFASTDTINTLNGTALTATDTVIIQLSVSSITDNLHANGLFFGMSDSTDFGGSSGVNQAMLVQMESNSQQQDINITATSFQDVGDTGKNVFEAAVMLGFDATLTANAAGYAFEIYGVHTTSPHIITGTFTGNEFVDYFGEGHFYYTAQRWNSGTAMVSTITEASITVIPEPATLGLVAAFGGAILFIRRRFMI